MHPSRQAYVEEAAPEVSLLLTPFTHIPLSDCIHMIAEADRPTRTW